MVVETNNPTTIEPVVSQEPQGLEETAEVAVEGTGTEAVQPETDTATEKVEKVQAKGVDLNKAIEKLSPEEQKAYKAFQAEFTKKSQSLSELEKAKAEYEETFNRLSSDPEISAIFKARQEKAAKAQQPDFSKMSDEEIFNYTVDKRVEEKLTTLEQKMEQKYGTYIDNNLAQQGNKIIKDFATEKKISVEESMELTKALFSYQPKLEDMYTLKYAKQIPEVAKQEALDDLDLKKKANLELGNVPSGVAPIVPERPTVRQALEMAKRETGIKLSE